MFQTALLVQGKQTATTFSAQVKKAHNLTSKLEETTTATDNQGVNVDMDVDVLQGEILVLRHIQSLNIRVGHVRLLPGDYVLQAVDRRVFCKIQKVSIGT